MKVELIYHTPLSIMAQAGRTAWDSFHKGGNYSESTDKITEPDQEFINRIVNKFKHESVSEHVTYNFYIKDISRACLQELARHRMANLTVKSTRYTLKELKSEEQFNDFDNEFDYKRASKYLVWTKNTNIDMTTFFILEDLRKELKNGVSNDIAKYMLPENYKTQLMWTINARSLKNFITLRTNKAALWEIRELAYNIFENIQSSINFYLKNSYIKKINEKIYINIINNYDYYIFIL